MWMYVARWGRVGGVEGSRKDFLTCTIMTKIASGFPESATTTFVSLLGVNYFWLCARRQLKSDLRTSAI
jgi:hypothetical protein